MKTLLTYFLSIFALILLISSCGNSSEENIILPKSIDQDSISVYGDSNFKFPVLSENARDQISQWGIYDDFESEIKSLNGTSISDLKIKMERVVTQVDSLSKKIPDTLFTSALFSRIVVIKTRTSLLHQELNKGRIDSVQLQNYIHEVNVSVKNLITQINEKFLKDDIDFQRRDDEKKELEKQKRFLDSIYQLELQDQ